jgi:hypothetical protein
VVASSTPPQTTSEPTPTTEADETDETGSTPTTETGDTDTVVTLTDTGPEPTWGTGEEHWTFEADTLGHDWSGPVALFDDGGLVATAEIPNDELPDAFGVETDIGLWRLEADGTVAWHVLVEGRVESDTEGMALQDHPIGVAMDASGGVLLSADVATIPGVERSWLRRYTHSGEQDWSVDLRGTAGPVAVVPWGEVWMASTEDGDLVVSRYSLDGVELGVARHERWDLALSLALDSASLPTVHARAGASRAGLLTLDPHGEEIGQRGVAANVTHIALARDGGHATLAQTVGGSELWLARYGEDGVQRWSTELLPVEESFAVPAGIAMDHADAVTVAAAGGLHSWLVKFDPDGALIWEIADEGYHRDLRVQPSGESVVASLSYGTDYGLLVRKRAP